MFLNVLGLRNSMEKTTQNKINAITFIKRTQVKHVSAASKKNPNPPKT